MAHTFLSLDMNLIHQATKDNVFTFWSALCSNDGVMGDDGEWVVEPSRILLDGRNDRGELVHPMEVLLKWTQWDADPEITIQALLDDAIEYTAAEFKSLKNDIHSIWYVEQEGLI